MEDLEKTQDIENADNEKEEGLEDINNEKDRALILSREQEEQLNKTLERINQINNTALKIGEIIHNKLATVAAIFYDNVMQSAMTIANKMVETLASYDFSSIIENTVKVITPIYYYKLLSRLNWPLFFIEDESLQKSIMTACKDKDDLKAVYDIVEGFFTEEYLSTMEMDWISCAVLPSERKCILQEALTMHKLGYYYSSVSVLMCQLYGIASDIVTLAESKGLILDVEGKQFLCEHFELDMKYIDKDKGKLFQTIMFTESGVLIWSEMVEYLKNVTFTSKSNFGEFDNQPLRNKITHGIQMNFGTKEHSIKALLTVDMLIQLLYHIDFVEPLSNKESDKQLDTQNS